MGKAVIGYDKELPEVPDRRAWEKPVSHLVKDDGTASGWRVEGSGRRPSQLLLVPKIREAVDAWRDGGYEGVSDVTRRLFEYWFEEDHEIPGFDVPLRYYFCQREAIETLVWLVEVVGERDCWKLIQSYAAIFKSGLFTKNLTLQTTMDGRREIRRFVPELNTHCMQALPPENLRRFAFKMATGSGKTWVMAMTVVWAHFHKQRVPSSELSTNFLIVAPNVIVYQRLERDFGSNRIFFELPLIPPEWRSSFSQKVILRDDTSEADRSCNLFLTNIHQLYRSREEVWTPQNAVEALLGKKPAQKVAESGQRAMLERVKSVKDLVVMNDEGHHVHEEGLEWSKSLLAIRRALPHDLSLWLDFSATPKDLHGISFPWTVCDYPLAQAVEDRIVKAPIIVEKESETDHPNEDPIGVTRNNITHKYGYWLRAAVQRWKEHYKIYRDLGVKPVLFIMAEKSVYADAIGRYLVKTGEFGLMKSEVLVIHTDTAGEITRQDLEMARTAARDIDRAESKVKVIVSVLMLREGWDVRNVTVVLGLRPFTARAEILPEQVIGRGLRLMAQVSPDRTQTLEVLGTRNLLEVLRTQLEAEGVGIVSTRSDPITPVKISPTRERLPFDISIPITKPSLKRDIRKLSNLKIEELDSIFEQEDLAKPFRSMLKLKFATTETEVHETDIATHDLPPVRELLARITKRVMDRAKLPNRFAELYPKVREYVATRCFGRTVDLENVIVWSHLARPELHDGISNHLVRRISELTIERRSLEFERSDFRLSETKPFAWRRNLPPLEARKTIFNYVATYNNFERMFAEFLDTKASDVLRFSALGTTEQGGSGTQFRIDYLKLNGSIGFYYPDWVVVQATKHGEVNWIIETKGRVWENTRIKDLAMRDWCERVTGASQVEWRYVRVNQSSFHPRLHRTLQEMITAQ